MSERINDAAHRFIVALAMERVGMAGQAQHAAEDLLDVVLEGNDPLSELLRAQIRPRGPQVELTMKRPVEATDGTA